MNLFKRYTITSALPYANGPVHIGHLAGVYIPADIYARYLRLRKKDVLFIGGSDEHGVPITIRAKQEGVTPQDVVNKYHQLIKDSFQRFGISFDIYSRTSSETHYKTASEFFRKLYDEGKFIEKTTEQYYDELANQFLADRYITGVCPHCGNDKAYGDQCEKCGTTLNATDLINPKSTLSGNVPVLKATKHWYLPLDKYEPFLKEWILEQHKEWKPNVYGQCKSWLDSGLHARAVSRDLDWGIPVPIEGETGKVLYVWFDAPIGYISATRELTDQWELYWKDKESRLIHFIGKDNIVFHCIIFPAMLKAEGTYILPDNVPGNEFLNLEGDKISTSRNWAVWLHEYLDEFPGMEDVLRYVLTANMPETKDNDFTWKDFQTRNNSELVAILGNFVNRALVLTQKYFDSKVPVCSELNAYDSETINQIAPIKKLIEDNLEQFRFREALKELMNLSRLGNKYLADTEPWKIFKDQPERVGTILNISLQIAANLAVLMEPFLPFTSAKLKKMLLLNETDWDNTGNVNLLDSGHILGTAGLLFSKIEDPAVEQQLEKLRQSKIKNQEKESEKSIIAQKPNVSYDEFSKMDIRTGTIIAAEKVAKTKKLLQLTIDTGIDTRTVVSGIAEYFESEKIIGQQVSILINLEPRELKGITSQGMILMATKPDGSLVFVSPAQKIENGGEIK